MTRNEAIKFMIDGGTISHRFFTPNEFIRFGNLGLEDENGYRLGSLHEFMNARQGEAWETGWRAVYEH